MNSRPDPGVRIRAELEETRARFHALLGSVSEQDFRTTSLNPGWTNGEILAHMTFGFIVVTVLLPMARLWGRLPVGSSKGFARTLDRITGPFNWINQLGARMQGKVFTRRRVGRVYDWAHTRLLKQLTRIRAEEWQRGMHYPVRWDPNFHDFMTLESLYHYPVAHFHFHLGQIAGANMDPANPTEDLTS